MGYFNNKWFKILIVLMIIILCFILFSKITKCFGASSVTIDSPEQYTFNLDNKFDEYSYIYIFYNPDFANEYNPPVHLMSFYFCASKTPIVFRQAMKNYNGVPYLTTFVKTADNSDFYSYSMNMSINDSFIYNIRSFNNFVNSNASLKTSDSSGFTFENPRVTTNTQFNNIVGLYISSDIKFENGDVAIPSTIFKYPTFDNITEIENGYPDGVIISRGDFSENDTLYFHLLKITNTINDGSNTIYYYSPKIFALNKDSKYYRTYEADTENKYSYYYINRSALTLDTNSSYLYVLSNSSESFTNSYGILQPDNPAGIYDVIQSDTKGVITSQDSTNDKIQNIDDTLNDNNVSSDTETNIEDSLNFDNKNDGLNNLNNGFFSRLTSMLSNLLGYNLSDDTSVSIPFPNSEKHLILHSKDIHDYVNGAIRVIINAFWIYVFSYYLWKFINKIYISVSSGNILDSFSSSDEAITNNML